MNSEDIRRMMVLAEKVKEAERAAEKARILFALHVASSVGDEERKDLIRHYEELILKPAGGKVSLVGSRDAG